MKKIISLTIMFIILTMPVALAHKPIFEGKDIKVDSPIVIDKHKVSYAVYGEIKNNEDIDFLKFKAKKGEEFFIQVALPDIKENKNFNPQIALIGKGIIGKDKVPFEIPKDVGAIVISSGETTEKFYEPFTQTSYNIKQTLRGEIPEEGEYYVAIYDTNGMGKYSLAIGEKEEFGLYDVLKFPYTYIRVKYFFSPGKTILSCITFVFGIVVLLILFKNRKRVVDVIKYFAREITRIIRK